MYKIKRAITLALLGFSVNTNAEETVYMNSGKGQIIHVKNNDLDKKIENTNKIEGKNVVDFTNNSNNYLPDNLKYYYRLGIGLNSIGEEEIKQEHHQGHIEGDHTFHLIEASLGARFNKFRLELTPMYFAPINSTENTTNVDANVNYIVKHSTDVKAIMLNGYYDIINIGKITVFGGGGVGINRLTKKVSGIAKMPETDDYYAHTQDLENIKITKINPFMWKLSLGAEMPLGDNNIVGEIQYNYIFLGKNKTSNVKGRTDILPHTYKVHQRDYHIQSITAGIRVNF